MEAQEFTVRDRLGPLRFRGQVLSDKRWDAGGKLRWTDMALYAVEGMAHDRLLRVTVECGGCRPARSFQTEQKIFDEGAIICGLCGEVFSWAEHQEEEPIRYALEITARSRVYHRVGSSCVRSKHRVWTAADIARDPIRLKELSPCPESGCRPAPLGQMRPNDRVAEERDSHQIYLFTNAAAIINKLYRRNGEITNLAAKLLKEAAVKDADIAAAMTDRRRI